MDYDGMKGWEKKESGFKIMIVIIVKPNTIPPNWTHEVCFFGHEAVPCKGLFGTL